MPFINVKTTEVIDEARQEVMDAELRRIAKECLGKGENWVMTAYEPQATLSFQGSGEAVAYVEVKCYGEPSASGADRMTGQVCAMLEQTLHISPNRVYVSYFGTNIWGWNGGNF
jgi:phenylpyruvate tautomerase PptA (4-oxalocrotonate tautomerase family)